MRIIESPDELIERRGIIPDALQLGITSTKLLEQAQRQEANGEKGAVKAITEALETNAHLTADGRIKVDASQL